ncbi:unnamed protein product [Penicillium salamii]|uniref:Uncharacterized protein n=1 Tax=Penicillium salamii TaxID=1612424 RepID=A0A9W4NR46_9EURO|nr:unnamed protein product [Penicillium salamii]CAG8181831.1 unnamed protein product [Penicillium salamii]CAG8213960.1 unnamed protein product [Penicillium salamii]CAG8248347.1 unnamed protein product [Penicillium salamii]CAG8270636.1 unnamed protein product [Penicillium salamii]
MVVVFYRDDILNFNRLVSNQITSFSIEVICIPNNDEILDFFVLFVASFGIYDADLDNILRAEWHNMCCALSRCEEAYLEHLFFSSFNLMVVFSKQVMALLELTAQVLLLRGNITVKNREARLYCPALISRLTEI